MGKRRTGTLLGVELPPKSREPLHRQLYGAIRTAILEGRLRPGTRIPSTRVAAEDLGVSRTTVVTAFEQLAAEGYLEARVGSGTRVAQAVPGDLRPASRGRKRSSGSLAGRIGRRSRMNDVPDLSFLGRVARPLRPGGGEPSLFPTELWSRLAARHWRQVIRNPGHSDSLGYRALRVAISDYVAKLRAVRCDPEQVLIVNGAQQALYLCAHALADFGDPVWMEDPGYPRARWAFRGAGLDVVPVPVDAEGLVVSDGAARNASPRLIYVTPSFQCPLGVMLSLARRFELLALARRCGAWIIEDDYFSEFRAGGRPVSSLQHLDQDDRVIYIGNFSKSIVPSLRIGYLVLPPPLLETFTRARVTMSRQPAGADQAILADFIGDGHLERHVRTTQRLYRTRQEALEEAIRSMAGGLLDTSPNGTGMYLVAMLRGERDDQAAVRAAAANGIDAIPLSAFTTTYRDRQGLVLGYAAFNEAVIRRSVAQLVTALAPPRRGG